MTEWYDVFEPNLIQNSLAGDFKMINLGHLIFGEKQWKEFGRPLPDRDDPLTSLYREWGTACSFSSTNNNI